MILVALALIIFGPSRLPKMGAQMGRMLREFQAAREGLTQQMREAFEEEPENDFAASTTSVDEETEPASDESTVAVLDPPPDGQTTPEAMGTAVDGAEGASGEVDLAEAAAAGVTAALHTPVEDPEAEEPEEAAASTGAPAAAVTPSTPADEVPAADPETPVSAAAQPETAPVETPAEPTVTSGPEATVEAEDAEAHHDSPDVPESEASPVAPDRAPATVADHHDTTAHSPDEESRAD
ncbi:MAG: twin-arginine translocase TatA/TatE family subunit [Candidatus Dormibacteraeota bacterium]|nr:twin-arginine translocase TatA/TatE family subunit [Candidatus Dormibacteraeota bacterium]MBO0743715.1 twin-arginine translocase TatA/TatE family subunit [Candidatus Dormibacteraeota bacterium]